LGLIPSLGGKALVHVALCDHRNCGESISRIFVFLEEEKGNHALPILFIE